MNKSLAIGLLLGVLAIFPAAHVVAQGAQVPFAALKPGGDKTVEVTADTLGIDQTSGKAVFSGNVVIGIDTMRMTADKVEVVYKDLTAGATGAISVLIATGNVTFTNGSEAAEADYAELDLDAGQIVMTGNVILTQGGNALSGQKMRIDLNAGTAVIEGRVQTILQSGTGN